MEDRDSLESLMAEIETRLSYMEPRLVTCVDPLDISHAKLPFKVISHRETLAWRMVELTKSAFENFKQDRLASAIVLTRAAVETAAGLWYLHSKVEAAVSAGAIGDIDDYLMRLILGSRTSEAKHQAINVLKFVDHVDKAVAGFRLQYDRLSEIAHPNRAGTTLLFSNPNPTELRTDYGSNARDNEPAKLGGVVNLNVALEMFEVMYNGFADIFPAFVALAEKELPPPSA